MARIEYENWFAREYAGEELEQELQALTQRLYYRDLTGVEGCLGDGALCLVFGKVRLYLWFHGEGCKIRLSGLPVDLVCGEKKDSALAELVGRRFRAIRRGRGMTVGSDRELALVMHLEDEEGSCQCVLKAQSTRIIRMSGKGDEILSQEPMPLIAGRYKTRIRRADGKIRMAMTNEAGEIMIPPIYSDIEPADYMNERYKVFRPIESDDLYEEALCGLCERDGKLLIPCEYGDLYCMRNGYYMVMDDRNLWWVLNEADEALFGPSVYGVDLHGTSREFLFPVEYNSDADCECIGIYDIALRTITCPAIFTKLHECAPGVFEGMRVEADGSRKMVRVDRYGTRL